ncbi:MAG: amidohydrolase family protein [Spirochaetaceae bacterium]|nr:amidohydrolase family protein [Spirochaetaceae bacterium]
MKAIKNVQLFDFVDYKENQYLIFDDTIVHRGSMEEFPEVSKQYNINQITDGEGGLVIPALVLCHTHIYSSFARGMALPFNPKNFLEILQQLWWKLDSKLDLEMIYHSAYCSAMGYIKHGVGTVIDHHASAKDITGSLEMLKKAVVDDFGLRGMFCFESSDRFDIDLCIQENLKFHSSVEHGLYNSHFGMHASMTLSDETLGKIKEVLGDMPIHIHVAESEMDQQDCQSKYGISVIERLDKFGLLNPCSLIVHGIYLSEKEMSITAERGCYLVLNPLSNMNNGVGLPDYRKIKSRGVKCLLGNDGMSNAVANEWQALLFSMHHRYSDPLGFGLDDLQQIILNSYEYANSMLQTKLGRFDKGYQADFMLLDEQNITPIDGSNALGHLFFGYAQSLRPSHFWSGGKLKMEDYKILGDHEEKRKRSVELAKKLWKDLS